MHSRQKLLTHSSFAAPEQVHPLLHVVHGTARGACPAQCVGSRTMSATPEAALMALLYIFQRSLVRQTCLLLVKLQWEVLPVQLQLAALDPTSKAQASELQLARLRP